ncbi:MAG TPA: hypothetical protein P5280_16735, partial [Cyclobacteriaceae bacterium]|nr:hypothetical protein [Cyclobacteriaceae bacterium]
MKLAKKHTERFTKENLRPLFEATEHPCISIYLPTHEVSSEVDQDLLRLKNLLRQTQDTLAEQKMRTPEITNLLDPLQELIDNRIFWQYQSSGLALFRSPNHFEFYRLPIKFDELVVVSDHFHTKPLLPLLTGDGRFYLLALSQDAIRFFEGTRFRIREIELDSDMPTSLAEATPSDDLESQLHLYTRTSHSGRGDRLATYYGTADAGDKALIKEHIKRFLRMVDNGVNEKIGGESVPLILGGVEFMRGLYREVAHYPHILDKGVGGNLDLLSPQELHQRVWPIVEPHFQQKLDTARDAYLQLAGTDDVRASANLEAVVSGAY